MLSRAFLLLPLAALALTGCSRPAESSHPVASHAPAEGTAVSGGDVNDVILPSVPAEQIQGPTATPGITHLTVPGPLTPTASPSLTPQAIVGMANAQPMPRFRVRIQQGQDTLMDWTQVWPGRYEQATGRIRRVQPCEGKPTTYPSTSSVRAELTPAQTFVLKVDLDANLEGLDCAVGGKGIPSRLVMDIQTPLGLKVGESQTWHSLPQGQALTITLTRES